LKDGTIPGAGFDVVTQEPMPSDHPFQTIFPNPDFVLTPHVAWASEEAIQALTDPLIDTIAAFCKSMPENVVSTQ
jgi:glycerate dehydrogenase